MSRITDDDRRADPTKTDHPGRLAVGNPEAEEIVPEDDSVIGRAFRRSLQVIVVVALLVALTLWLVGGREDQAPEQTLSNAGPSEVVQDAEAPDLPFHDVRAEMGIDFVHHNGATGDKLLPETMGSGAAFFDWDDDGDPDLLLVDGSDWPHATTRRSPASHPVLYRNDGDRFTDISRQVGLDGFSFYGTGVTVADADGDGARDLFLTAVGPNHLLLRRGERYVDATAEAGVAGEPNAWSTAAAFFDADNDGDLDLFVGQYVQWSKEIDFELDYRLTGVGRAYGPPQNYQGTFPTLYRNEGGGRFVDISEAAGIQVKNPATGAPMAKTLAVLPIDVDRDGFQDLIVANDTVRNFFYHNRGDGTFEESAELNGLAYDRNGNATGAMGIDAGYFRNDGELGVAIGNFANEMTSFYVTQGDPSILVDEAIGEGIGAPSRRMLSFGVFLFDADLDGRLDLLQSNGHLEEEIGTVDPSQTYRQAGQLFWNGGLEHGFVPVAEENVGDLSRAIVGRSSTYGDIDGDGDLDVLVTQVAGPPLLLRNDQSTGHHWLRLRLVGRGANRDALGARVELEAGGQTQRRAVMPTRGYLAQMETVLTFGLGETDRVEALRIVWPDGSRQEVPPPAVDQLHRIEQDGIEQGGIEQSGGV